MGTSGRWIVTAHGVYIVHADSMAKPDNSLRINQILEVHIIFKGIQNSKI